MKLHGIKRVACIAMALVLLLSGLAAAGTIPAKVASKSGITIYKNEKAQVDVSNLTEGYLTVKYTGGKSVKIKVQIAKEKGATYTYDLNNLGNPETFPLTEGNGTYTIKVFENTTGTKYAQAYSVSVSLALRDPILPFLYSNQYVNFNSESKVVSTAAELTKGKTGELDKVKAIFDYVVDNFTYDYELAKNPPAGYLPNVDKVLENKKGICFDYSAVMAAMLRSQDLPCKLVVGYAGQTYHAWINVYLTGQGWVDKVIYFDGTDWTLMDPTFTSTGKRSDTIMKYVTTDTNYTQKYAY